jgi:hypothetical protein
MFKKIFIITALLCALPLLARAATLNTWVKTTGGAIVVNSGTPQRHPGRCATGSRATGSRDYLECRCRGSGPFGECPGHLYGTQRGYPRSRKPEGQTSHGLCRPH